MPRIRVYTKNYCPYCTRAKNLLRQKNVSFEEIDIEGDPQLAEQVFAKTGFRTVPQIFIDEECIGGFDDMAAMDRQGVLNKKLGL